MALAYHQTQLLPLYFLAVAICAYLPGRGPFTLALSPAPFQSIKKIFIQNGSSLSSDTATTIVFPRCCYLCISPRQGSVHTCD